MTGRFQIKIKINSADQKTADFVIEKDVRAGATATATAKTKAKATAEPYSVNCGSWLACDGINLVYLTHRGACIAGKPAPTEKQIPQKSRSHRKADPTEKQIPGVCESAFRFCFNHSGRLLGRRALLLILI
ncbi:hypothetical protein QF043_003881 [Pseudomonas sp. W3I7]|uniref:hypothetical protein n=1 Tax=Pseudomonas sp. W3I7 TaxID=3042292 RepID=UPI0027932A4C|nr:hypothetical protein [Pseudomonas sp. W3I7]MDQ0705089.1 hypothetical protein [Pseudomonas sp. W3I7]